MDNKLLKKVVITILMVGVLLGIAAPQSVRACEEDYEVMPTSLEFYDWCWMCDDGCIYKERTTTGPYFKESYKCTHGYTRGTDSVYLYYVSTSYKCGKCGYGWEDSKYPYERVECGGSNTGN